MFKERGKTLDIKMHKLYSGCQTNEELRQEILSCDSFGKRKTKSEKAK